MLEDGQVFSLSMQKAADTGFGEKQDLPGVPGVAMVPEAPQGSWADLRKECRIEDPVRVRLIVFDFDQTLSEIHVFKSLAGWDGGVRFAGPTASSELGQLRLIKQLDACEPFAAAGGFATVAFGGHARCGLLRYYISALRREGAEMVVCTKGLVGPAQWCLRDLGVLDLFTRVYGLTGEDYGTQAYDDQVCDKPPSDLESQLLGGEENANWGSKADLIARLREERGLAAEQAVLAEDDPEEIRDGSRVARTVYVSEGKGLTGQQLWELLGLVQQVAELGGPEGELARRAADSRADARHAGAAGGAGCAARLGPPGTHGALFK